MTEYLGERRRTIGGWALHCCCVCHHLGPWDKNWSWWGSYKDEEDGELLAKFCSSACKNEAGNPQKIRKRQLESAVALEHRR